MTTPLDTALALHARGLWTVPITAIDDRRAGSPGKQPIHRNWGLVRHTEESLRDTYASHPKAGVGLKLGPEGGIVDIEVDDRDKAGPVLERLFAGEVPATLGWESANGAHLILRWDNRLARYGKAIVRNHPAYPGVELRLGYSADDPPKQYQSVCPPSLNADGKPRTWNGHGEILPLPESVFTDFDRHLLTPPKPAPEPPRPTPPNAPDAERRAVAYLARCDPAISGQAGHNKAFKAACKVGPGFDLPPATAYRLLWDHYNPRCEPPWSERELQHKVEDAYQAEDRRGWLLNVERPGPGRPRAVRAAPDPPPPPNDPVRPGNPGRDDPPPEGSEDDPHRLARLYLQRIAGPNGVPTLRYWLEQWHRWDGSCYQTFSPGELRSELTALTKREFDRVACAAGSIPKHVTTRLIGNVMQALSALALLPAHLCPGQPAWLCDPSEGLPDPKDVLPVANGLVYLPDLVEDRTGLMPPTPLFFSPNTLGYDFIPDPPRPDGWLAFLESLWPDDQAAIDALQEWFGYCLTPDTSQQKILVLIGPKRSGKGTIARVLRRLIGPRNVASPTLSQLATNFGAAPLIGKTLAIFSDARLSGRIDAQAVIEQLLAISGEDAKTIDRKHISEWSGTLPTRFLLISNELPRLGDASGAMVSRMIVLRMVRSFLGAEDVELGNRLMAELPSILLWSIVGWARLRQRGRFVQPPSARELLDDLEGLSSPVTTFVTERCRTGPDCHVLVKDLYAAWKAWCAEEGREHSGDSAGFGRALRASLPTLKTRQFRLQGRHTREFVGVELIPTPAF